jgi:hypothetical protein
MGQLRGWGDSFAVTSVLLGLWLGIGQTAIAQHPIDLDSKLIEASPTWQKWLKQVPDVRSDIAHQPAFRPRLRFGYVNFDASAGAQFGLEDLHIRSTPITFSANYRANSTGQNRNWGADWHYQLNPLGAVVNLAPTIGYRNLTIDDQSTTGLNLGLRTRLNLSRGGGADLTIDQSWVAPGSDREAGLTKLSFGYAITPKVRIATDWQQQNTDRARERQWGISLEWML